MSNTGRIQIQGAGVGEISEADIERRALEMARADGRAEAGEQDIFRAREELTHPGPPPAPEADESEGPVTKWSEAEASRPHRGVQSGTDDEETVGEQLVNEGLDEADQSQRVAATEPSAE